MNTPDKTDQPITIIGGYLGAGKTTLVNHLLRNANGLKLAILVNEFGELPIDADLIEAEDDNLISLAGGCICCSYGNDMVAALMELSQMHPKPDHVVVEASGVAIPGSIAGSVSFLDGFSLDGILTLVDAYTLLEKASDTYLSDTILRQLSDSNIILLNKVDLIGAPALEEVQNWIAEHAPQAQIIQTQNAKVPLAVALQRHDSFSTEHASSQVQHIEGFETEFLSIEKPVDAYSYGTKLIAKHPHLVRAKGFVRDVSGMMKTIQIVGKRLDIHDAPQGVKQGIVLISQKNIPSM